MMMIRAGHVARRGDMRVAYRVWSGDLWGQRPLGRPGRRWEGNNTLRLQELGLRCMDCIDTTQDRDRWRALVNAVMNIITLMYRSAGKSLARPTSRCILFDGENISLDASLVVYTNSTNIPPIMILPYFPAHKTHVFPRKM